MMKDKIPDVLDASGSYTTYLEYNKVLRTWFVAFGVGGPAFFLINGNIVEKLKSTGSLRYVSLLFLVGVAAQVLGAIVNKFANLYVHNAYSDSDERRTGLKYDFAEWLIEQFWLDMLIDVITIALFGFATWMMMMVLTQ